MRCSPVRLVFLLLVLAPAVAGAASTDLPERTDTNLIVVSYNIQFLGERHHDLDKLAQVIRHFDVCGILEVKSDFILAGDFNYSGDSDDLKGMAELCGVTQIDPN